MNENKSSIKLPSNLHNLGSLIGLILLIAVVSIMKPQFLEIENILNILRQVSINAVIAFGMTFVILAGGIDLSVGSILALSGAVLAGSLKGGMSPFFAVVLCLLLGVALGAFNGVVITKGRAAPFIATLATMTIFRGLTLVYTTGKPISDLGDSSLFVFMGKGMVGGLVPVPVIIMLILFIIFNIILTSSTFGRKVYAVGGNQEVSRISGIKVDWVKIRVYAISGFCAALAGIILTSRLNSAQPTAGTAYELDAIAAVVLGGTSLSGGKGWLIGTLIGALIIGVLNSGLNILGVDSYWQLVIKGSVILLAVLLDRKED